MRYSNEKDDPGYLNYWEKLAEGKDIYVFVNGKEVKNVMTADDANGGYVKAYSVDADGSIFEDPEMPGHAAITEYKDVDVTFQFYDRA